MFSPNRKPQKPSGKLAAKIAGTMTPSFPPAWLWLTDEAVPTWVKKNYSPRESWKDKPFSKEDARFFFKGIEELSEIFTEERSKIPNYFSHPKYRSAYLLYFLPLQAAKFITLFNLHPNAIDAAIAHGKETGTLRIADLGSGPGTASLALLLWLMGLPDSREALPGKVELTWVDSNRDAMEDGRKLVELLSDSFPKLRGRVSVRTHVGNWWQAPETILGETSLLFLGHVLNESAPRSRESDLEEGRETLDAIWQRMVAEMRGGGMLIVEPAARSSSQRLSRLRDAILEEGLLEKSPTSIWGPCLHAGACPLAEGRDWCHFSVPVRIPGQWFKTFSQALSSERQWAKFSYLWLAAPDRPAPMPDPALRRVISDVLSARKGPEWSAGASGTILLCEPEEPLRWETKKDTAPYRGDVIRVRK